MGGQGEDGTDGTRADEDRAPGASGGSTGQALADLIAGPQTPLYHADHADRYDRQQLIGAYEREYGCKLVVVCDALFGESVTFFEELVSDASEEQDLHLLLDSPGGDGETALRIARSAQARCRRFIVIVPDQAKSAGTILALGADEILMGPTSDLGPIDPQLRITRGDRWELVAAKDLIAAVAAAELAVQKQPETYPLHASLLADVTAVMVQQARAAMLRSNDLLDASLKCAGLSDAEIKRLKPRLRQGLITKPSHHGATLGAGDAHALGLPVTQVDPTSLQWKAIWRLWTKYFVLDRRVYEGRRASRIAGKHYA